MIRHDDISIDGKACRLSQPPGDERADRKGEAIPHIRRRSRKKNLFASIDLLQGRYGKGEAIPHIRRRTRKQEIDSVIWLRRTDGSFLTQRLLPGRKSDRISL
ncbi:MAG: hypothetical protein M3R67_09780 [Acidobacteriota bacterium]|nr:hypothetical protein [Acidobacteriota bacterium]